MNGRLDLRGRTVIVTGASSGIGEATARAPHAAGAQPVPAACRTQRIEVLSADLGGTLRVQTDVTSRDVRPPIAPPVAALATHWSCRRISPPALRVLPTCTTLLVLAMVGGTAVVL